jgi:hypothetical protein
MVIVQVSAAAVVRSRQIAKQSNSVRRFCWPLTRRLLQTVGRVVIETFMLRDHAIQYMRQRKWKCGAEHVFKNLNPDF